MSGNATALITERSIWVHTAAGLRRLPASVYDDDGMLLAGDEACKRGATDPDHFEPRPWSYLTDSSLVLRDTAHPIHEVCELVLRRAGLTAVRDGQITLIHPTHWTDAHLAPFRTVLRACAAEVLCVPLAVGVAEVVQRSDIIAVTEIGRTTSSVAKVHAGALTSISMVDDVSELAGCDALANVCTTLAPGAHSVVVGFDEVPAVPIGAVSEVVGPEMIAAVVAAAHLVSQERTLRPASHQEANKLAETVFGSHDSDDAALFGTRRWLWVAAGVITALSVAGGSWLAGNDPSGRPAGHAANAREQVALTESRGHTAVGEHTSVQVSDVTVTIPSSWHLGWSDMMEGHDGDFRAELRPRHGIPYAAPPVYVSRTRLADDADTDGVVEELRRAIAQDPVMFETEMPVLLPRAVALHYEERDSVSAPIHWYVLILEGRQLSVGCPGETASEHPCLGVLDSLRITS
ncbi:type VII secretion-associated protein [Hoyosella sp. YIM 151337]|uniref:type VII secretion-associated protein n=1 Tax=Hoyosella sp. YIM 151337 TaxID=2992742 RepID=UPI002235BA43|nr:type VII secretion-associated protein [Hoyosella sp. YIM 151337]MCW4352527.1 type VII secretion-associated protein [Hoyosella sp. YIM 151337]